MMMTECPLPWLWLGDFFLVSSSSSSAPPFQLSSTLLSSSWWCHRWTSSPTPPLTQWPPPLPLSLARLNQCAPPNRFPHLWICPPDHSPLLHWCLVLRIHQRPQPQPPPRQPPLSFTPLLPPTLSWPTLPHWRKCSPVFPCTWLPLLPAMQISLATVIRRLQLSASMHPIHTVLYTLRCSSNNSLHSYHRQPDSTSLWPCSQVSRQFFFVLLFVPTSLPYYGPLPSISHKLVTFLAGKKLVDFDPTFPTPPPTSKLSPTSMHPPAPPSHHHLQGHSPTSNGLYSRNPGGQTVGQVHSNPLMPLTMMAKGQSSPNGGANGPHSSSNNNSSNSSSGSAGLLSPILFSPLSASSVSDVAYKRKLGLLAGPNEASDVPNSNTAGNSDSGRFF